MRYGRLDHARADQDLARTGAGGEVDGAAKVVAARTTTGLAVTPTGTGGSPAAGSSSAIPSADSTAPAGSR